VDTVSRRVAVSRRHPMRAHRGVSPATTEASARSLRDLVALEPTRGGDKGAEAENRGTLRVLANAPVQGSPAAISKHSVMRRRARAASLKTPSADEMGGPFSGPPAVTTIW